MASKNPLSVSDLQDIQAGPVVLVPNRFTVFLFFVINDVQNYRNIFREKVLPHITTSDAARKMREKVIQSKSRSEMATVAAINVSFSQQGLSKLISDADTKDPSFKAGQYASAPSLGDDTEKWLPHFKGDSLHGLFEISGYPENHILAEVEEKIKSTLGTSAISIVYEHYGKARPGAERGHEHFGFNDGISQPFVQFADDKQQIPKRENFPGQTVVDPGVLILGQPGDQSESTRPPWAKNGSFVIYRHLKQLVPEFNHFLRETVLGSIFDPPHPMADSDDLQKRIDFLGARLMGRWKSGLPVVLTPMNNGQIPVDDPTVGKDPTRNNNFDYGTRGDVPRMQFLCPFAGHTRKAGPRTDILEGVAESHMIVRGGIAYGCEVTSKEKAEHTTLYERGLSFVCYQSSVEQGFEFIQKSWSNKQSFPPNTGGVEPGFDPIIGQKDCQARTMTGYDAENLTKPLHLPKQYVISQGGEYFFLPSITTLNQISAAQ